MTKKHNRKKHQCIIRFSVSILPLCDSPPSLPLGGRFANVATQFTLSFPHFHPRKKLLPQIDYRLLEVAPVQDTQLRGSSERGRPEKLGPPVGGGDGWRRSEPIAQRRGSGVAVV